MSKRKRIPREYIALTVKEPLPLFGYRRCGDPEETGPAYSAGSVWFYATDPLNAAHAERCKAALEDRGFTVSLERVER